MGAILAAAVTVGIAWRLAPRARAIARAELDEPWRQLVERVSGVAVSLAQGGAPTPTPTRKPTLISTPFSALLPSPTPRPVTPTVTATNVSATPASVGAADAPISPTEPTGATTAPPAVVIYMVQKGDTLSGIAARYGVGMEEIARANGISVDGVLSVGRKLVIPGVLVPTATPTRVPPTITPTDIPTVRPTDSPTPPPTMTPTPSPALSGVAAVVAVEQQARPTPTPTVTPQPSATPLVHVMAKGEHIGILALRYGVTEAQIAAANGISTEAILSVGQRLIIPQRLTTVPSPTGVIATTAPENGTPLPQNTALAHVTATTHVVSKGDTLGSIAMRYGVESERIAEANGITLKTVLQVGQTLRIPAGALPAGGTPTFGAPDAPVGVLRMAARLPTPTLTPLPTCAYRYRPPTLLWPTHGSVVEAGVPPLLNWTSVGILADGEWYELRLWMPGQPEEPQVIYTKATAYRLSDRTGAQTRRTRRFAWQVTVVSRPVAGGPATALSASSEVYSFILE